MMAPSDDLSLIGDIKSGPGSARQARSSGGIYYESAISTMGTTITIEQQQQCEHKTLKQRSKSTPTDDKRLEKADYDQREE